MGLFSTKSVKFRPDLPYLTEPEARAFKLMRTGPMPSLSFFRIKKCDLPSCEQETLKVKRCCSKKCYDELTKGLTEKIKTLLKGRK